MSPSSPSHPQFPDPPAVVVCVLPVVPLVVVVVDAPLVSVGAAVTPAPDVSVTAGDGVAVACADACIGTPAASIANNSDAASLREPLMLSPRKSFSDQDVSARTA